jgi:hypothetical protein
MDDWNLKFLESLWMVNNNHGRVNSKSNHSQYFNGYGCECLTPFPLIFHWYCGGKFNRWWKPEYTNIPTACYNSMNVITYGHIEYILEWASIELTSVVVIGTNGISWEMKPTMKSRSKYCMCLILKQLNLNQYKSDWIC